MTSIFTDYSMRVKAIVLKEKLITKSPLLIPEIDGTRSVGISWLFGLPHKISLTIIRYMIYFWCLDFYPTFQEINACLITGS